MKKLLSIILALVLIMSVVPMGVFTLTASAEQSVSFEYSGTSSIDTTNKVGNFNAYEGGFLDTGLKYNNTTDLGVSNTPVWEEGTTLNTTGVFTSLKQGGYDGKKTIVWKGNCTGDLTKGSIIYQADFTIYDKTTGWNGTNWGFVVAKVNGHYVSTGFGVHGNVGAAYKNATVVDGSNIGEQSGANTNFLGASAVGNYIVAGTTEGVTVTLTAVLTSTSLTTYINGVKGQTFDFTGKTVEPMFAFAWGSGNANDKITNVKFMGDGIVEIPCEHSYSFDCDAECNFCGETRTVDENLHIYASDCDAYCDNCGSQRTVDASAHVYASDCDAYCDNCGSQRTVDASVQHNYADNCDTTCELCGAERISSHTYSSDCDAECDGCGVARTPLGNHTFDGPQDAFCNGCGAERIALNALKKTGALVNIFNEQLAGSAAVYGTSFDLKPSQFGTESVSLGGAIFDITKGYTISADFIVKTNSSMESHFGITAIVIDDQPYTFGMLSNGNWNTPEGNIPTQKYIPYVRKNNSNDLINAKQITSVTATDEGETINVKVVVTGSSVTYYLNNVEAKTIDLTGKTVLPYAAFTSRGANVTVTNIDFYGAGVKNHTSHNFASDCDAVCNDCYAVRSTSDHQYDNDTCDANCNVCGSIREVTHSFAYACDDTCDVCGTTRNVTHTYTDDCDEECDIEGCTGTRTAPHTFENECDTECNFCGKTRFVNKHVYDDEIDLDCNRCDYVRPAYAFDGMADHTDEMYLNNMEFRENLIANGNFTLDDKVMTTDDALTINNSGKVVIETKLTFNGNVDNYWVGVGGTHPNMSWVNDGNDGDGYGNAYGKVAIKVGTYYNATLERTMNVFVSLRRASAAAFLFDDNDNLLGEFGYASSKTAAYAKLTVLYDIYNKVIHLWVDGTYINAVTLENLKDFTFDLGFYAQGLGTTVVDPTATETNAETTKNTVTYSDIKLLGDFVADPLFELPATEHTHEYSDANDLICNTCGAEKIKFSTLKNTTGKLEVLFEDQLKNAAVASGTSFDLSPVAFATNSIVLGGAKYDFTKGGYTISADFTVKTNSSLESHFGITAIVINNEPYTFGMLANGNWSTSPASPVQLYAPYIRKNNGNDLISADRVTSVTATDEGETINVKVVVTGSSVTYYLNNVEAKTIDLTGKTVLPYAALTSRGANVSISNIQFNGNGVTNCVEHKYSGSCDAICDICYGGVREATPHVYDNDYDTTCNKCGFEREIEDNSVITGITGDCTWTLDGTVLTISGNGDMGDCYYNEYQGAVILPWGRGITKVIIEDGVTNIGDSVFSGCVSLISITIPDGVTSIGDYAFENCESLTSITIPDSVTSIGSWAFNFCKSLTSITIPDSVTNIGKYAFLGCNSLTNITIPDNVASIGNGAIEGCSSLKSITIPDSVTSIGKHAFLGCNSLTDVWYEGSKSDRDNISIGLENDKLTSATWHYNCCIKSDTKEHVYDDDYDADCNLCGALREVPEKVVIGDLEIEMMPGDELPLDERIDTKYILGWKNPDGSKYEGTTYAEGIVAEFVETKMMTVKYQLGRDGNSIRYIASIDETERYNSVGWVFSITNENPKIGGANVTDKNDKKVYNGIIASGQEIDAATIYGGADYSKYLYVFEITDILEADADIPIYVRPYVEMNDGRIVYGDVSMQTLNGLKAR